MPSDLQQQPAITAPAPATSAHPADSSRIFQSLLSLARRAGTGKVQRRADDELIAPTVLRSLLSALHYRDRATVFHARRVAVICMGVAGELGWDDSQSRILEVAALLHDLGKLSVPDSILHKPGSLSADESEFISVNHKVGLTLMQAFRIHPSVIETIAQMTSVSNDAVASESCDQVNTALGARILAVADVYDSLSHDQVYRKHFEPPEILQALLDSERQLDRNVIGALRRWLKEGGSELIGNDDHAQHLIDAGAPVDEATVREASSICHACSYLYALETLYDGYYIVDSDLRVVISSLGLNQLLPRTGLVVGEKWNRKAIGAVDQLGNSLGDESLSDAPRAAVKPASMCDGQSARQGGVSEWSWNCMRFRCWMTQATCTAWRKS